MKKLNLTLIFLTSLMFLGCNDTNKSSPSNEEMILEVTLERNLTSEHPLDIIVKLTNLGEHTVYYNDFSFPNVDGGMAGNFFTILEDGIKVKYKGIFVFTGSTVFTSIAAGETKASRTSLDRHYEVHQGTHHYQISRVDWTRAKTIDDTEEAYAEFVDEHPNALAPEKYTSEYVTMKQNTLEFEATIHTVREPSYKKH